MDLTKAFDLMEDADRTLTADKFTFKLKENITVKEATDAVWNMLFHIRSKAVRHAKQCWDSGNKEEALDTLLWLYKGLTSYLDRELYLTGRLVATCGCTLSELSKTEQPNCPPLVLIILAETVKLFNYVNKMFGDYYEVDITNEDEVNSHNLKARTLN